MAVCSENRQQPDWSQENFYTRLYEAAVYSPQFHTDIHTHVIKVCGKPTNQSANQPTKYPLARNSRSTQFRPQYLYASNALIRTYLSLLQFALKFRLHKSFS